MSVQTLMQSALLRFGIEPTNVRFADDFYSALNNAQNDFATTRSWGFLRTTANLTTTASTRTVALPSDFGKMYDIPKALVITAPTANAGTIVELLHFQSWLSNEWEDGTDTDVPAFAYILGSSLYLSPIPDAAYTINIAYYKIPTNIADSSTAITVPVVYQELLQVMITKRLQLAGYSNITEIQISEAEIQRLLNNAARDDVRRYGSTTFNLPSSSYKIKTV